MVAKWEGWLKGTWMDAFKHTTLWHFAFISRSSCLKPLQGHMLRQCHQWCTVTAKLN